MFYCARNLHRAQVDQDAKDLSEIRRLGKWESW